MDTERDTDDLALRAALRREAEVPLGMTARLEAAVVRRGRNPRQLTMEEKWCLACGAIVPFLSAGAAGLLVLLVAVAGVVGYLQWTVLVEEGDQTA